MLNLDCDVTVHTLRSTSQVTEAGANRIEKLLAKIQADAVSVWTADI